VPKLPLRQSTLGRMARSAALFVGSTSGWRTKVHNAWRSVRIARQARPGQSIAPRSRERLRCYESRLKRISHGWKIGSRWGVSRYFRFCLSFRDVEEFVAAHGIVLTYEAVQYWRRKFARAYAKRLRRWRPRHGDDWPLDEAFLTTRREITGSALVV
jgi:hypothetical protein